MHVREIPDPWSAQGRVSVKEVRRVLENALRCPVTVNILSSWGREWQDRTEIETFRYLLLRGF